MIDLIPVSGGKDSQAVSIWAKQNLKEYTPIFNNLKWDSPLTYSHLQQMEVWMGKKIQFLESKKYINGLVEQAIFKGRFPSQGARFCTEEFKIFPTIDFILSQNQDVRVHQGVRAEESQARRFLDKNDDYFKFYFEPYKYKGKYDKEIKALRKRIKKANSGNTLGIFGDNLSQELNNLVQKNIPTLKPKYHTYRKKEVFAWCEKFSAEINRPILKWTADNVFSFIYENDQFPNPLYKLGFKRVGCFPCVLCTLGEILIISEIAPEIINQIDMVETEGNLTFFAIDKIPALYHTKIVTRNGKKN